MGAAGVSLTDTHDLTALEMRASGVQKLLESTSRAPLLGIALMLFMLRFGTLAAEGKLLTEDPRNSMRGRHRKAMGFFSVWQMNNRDGPGFEASRHEPPSPSIQGIM